MVAAVAIDGSEVPTALVAVTRNRYAVPFVSPLTVQKSPQLVSVRYEHPSEGSTVEVTLNCVIRLPLAAGEVQRTVMRASPAVAVTSSGASGVPNGEEGTTEAELAEATPVPTALVARTSKA
ncbi:unannotated protein [freshwater metagenome]|uniref:Unannotated protein n=1 Tax=freshwater metagenome TaxID=449393 RepID=A0A6J5YIM0_9ZZZZ